MSKNTVNVGYLISKIKVTANRQDEETDRLVRLGSLLGHMAKQIMFDDDVFGYTTVDLVFDNLVSFHDHKGRIVLTMRKPSIATFITAQKAWTEIGEGSDVFFAFSDTPVHGWEDGEMYYYSKKNDRLERA